MIGCVASCDVVQREAKVGAIFRMQPHQSADHSGYQTPLTMPAWESEMTQSWTPPFQSAILPSRILTITTRTSSPSMKHSLPPSPVARSPGELPRTAAASPSESPKVLLRKWASLHHCSSSLPVSTIRASPLMVALILDIALVFMLSSKLARLD